MIDSPDQVATLMIIFGVGYMAVFAVFALLYWHAYRKRTELDLNELELFDTRIDIRESLLNVSIAAISVALAVFGGRYAATSGMIYMLTPIILMTHSRLNRRRRRKLETAIAPAL
jgi:nitrate/nitrite transporter NarK